MATWRTGSASEAAWSAKGDSYDEALADVTSVIRFHLETFGAGEIAEDPEILEAFVTEAIP